MGTLTVEKSFDSFKKGQTITLTESGVSGGEGEILYETGAGTISKKELEDRIQGGYLKESSDLAD